ncbi:hypothetical protein C8J57DRAFT_603519 [Mycena rebaudengoi]|nr:hypothetical protein C8J57DRAFT_603519 [Mycena rebaudengoi]
MITPMRITQTVLLVLSPQSTSAGAAKKIARTPVLSTSSPHHVPFSACVACDPPARVDGAGPAIPRHRIALASTHRPHRPPRAPRRRMTIMGARGRIGAQDWLTTAALSHSRSIGVPSPSVGRAAMHGRRGTASRPRVTVYSHYVFVPLPSLDRLAHTPLSPPPRALPLSPGLALSQAHAPCGVLRAARVGCAVYDIHARHGAQFEYTCKARAGNCGCACGGRDAHLRCSSCATHPARLLVPRGSCATRHTHLAPLRCHRLRDRGHTLYHISRAAVIAKPSGTRCTYSVVKSREGAATERRSGLDFPRRGSPSPRATRRSSPLATQRAAHPPRARAPSSATVARPASAPLPRHRPPRYSPQLAHDTLRGERARQ